MKRLMAGFVILALTLSSGCWGRRDINDLALVVAIGIDSPKQTTGAGAKDNATVTLQYANPVVLVPGMSASSGAGGQKAFWTVAGDGRTLREAVGKIAQRVPKLTFFGQNRTVIFGSDMARRGLAPNLDRLNRSLQTRSTVYMFVARESAKKALEIEMPIYRATGIGLANMMDILQGSGMIYPVRQQDLLRDLATGVTAPVLPTLSVVPQTSVNVEEKKGQGEPSKVIEVDGLAVFDTKGKLKVFFNAKETKGVMIARNKMRQQEVIVSCPVEGKSQPITVLLNRVRSRIRVIIARDGTPSFEISVKTQGQIYEHYGEHPGVGSVRLISELEKNTNTEVAGQVKAALRSGQRMHADVFGLGEEIGHQYPDYWEQIKRQWPQIYPMAKVNVRCSTTINQRGLSVEVPGSLKERGI